MDSHGNVVNSQFLTRLIALPVISSCLNFSVVTYRRSKSSCGLANGFLTAVENAAFFLISKSEPIVEVVGVRRLFATADNLAVHALELAENNVPILTLPTDQAVRDTRDCLTVLITPFTIAIDGLGCWYEFITRLVRDVTMVTKRQLEVTVLPVLGFYNFMNFVHFYVNDIQTRRHVIAGVAMTLQEGPSTSKDIITLKSLDEGYAFGCHRIYAFVVNTILTLQYDLSSRITSLISIGQAPATNVSQEVSEVEQPKDE